MFVDFIGLSAKSKRRVRPASGVSAVNKFRTNNLSPIKAVIDLQRLGNASSQSSNPERKVVNLSLSLSLDHVKIICFVFVPIMCAQIIRNFRLGFVWFSLR